MARVIKSKIKIREIPEKWKMLKKPEEEISEQEKEEDEQEQSLEQISFTPRTSGSGLEAPILEVSGSTQDSQETRTPETRNPSQGAAVYNMPDYTPQTQTAKIAEASKSSNTLISDRRNTVDLTHANQPTSAWGQINSRDNQKRYEETTKISQAEERRMPFDRDSREKKRSFITESY